MPAEGIQEVAIHDEKGDLLYEGVTDRVVDAKLR